MSNISNHVALVYILRYCISSYHYIVHCTFGFLTGFLTGFYKKSRDNNLIFTVAGATAKYRHRIPFGKKFEMRTKIVYTDDKWVYYLTEFFSENRLTSSILARTGTLKNGKLISTEEASKYFELDIPPYDIPEWISLWIKSDEKFPGFQK